MSLSNLLLSPSILRGTFLRIFLQVCVQVPCIRKLLIFLPNLYVLTYSLFCLLSCVQHWVCLTQWTECTFFAGSTHHLILLVFHRCILSHGEHDLYHQFNESVHQECVLNAVKCCCLHLLRRFCPLFKHLHWFFFLKGELALHFVMMKILKFH